MQKYMRRAIGVGATLIALLVGLMVPSFASASTVPSAAPLSGAAFQAECPPTVSCVVVPAAFTANNGNITDYGNYDTANRPTDMRIDSIVIHDTEGSLESALATFQNPTSYVSAHYVIAPNGTVYQMVRTKDVAWHAGNWYTNMHSVGIEHVGHASQGGTEYTDAMYEASAKLVKYLTSKYNIPRDRGHILGHDNVPAPKTANLANMNKDPGPFWNWQKYMWLIGVPVLPTGGLNSGFVTVAPAWPFSKQPVTGCWPEQFCVPDGPQSTNFVYLRTEARQDASFFTDPILGQGSTALNNNAARLFYGQTFGLADKPKVDPTGMWDKVWVNGSSGWFHSPWAAPTALPAASSKYITPKPGKSAVAVYGRPSPEASAYPASLLASPPASFWIPALAPADPLAYTIAAGQKYKVLDTNPPNDHFYAWSLTADTAQFPYDHTVFAGTDTFIQIQVGGRPGYVKKSDVTVVA